MPSVRIQRGDTVVELNANEASYSELADKALKVLQDTVNSERPRLEVGFASSSNDRRWTPDHRNPNYMSDYGFAPVKASDEMEQQ